MPVEAYREALVQDPQQNLIDSCLDCASIVCTCSTQWPTLHLLGHRKVERDARNDDVLRHANATCGLTPELTAGVSEVKELIDFMIIYWLDSNAWPLRLLGSNGRISDAMGVVRQGRLACQVCMSYEERLRKGIVGWHINDLLRAARGELGFVPQFITSVRSPWWCAGLWPRWASRLQRPQIGHPLTLPLSSTQAAQTPESSLPASWWAACRSGLRRRCPICTSPWTQRTCTGRDLSPLPLPAVPTPHRTGPRSSASLSCSPCMMATQACGRTTTIELLIRASLSSTSHLKDKSESGCSNTWIWHRPTCTTVFMVS